MELFDAIFFGTSSFYKRNFIPCQIVTIPPKTIIPTDKTLVEADCVPTAILHFGTDENVSGDILKAEYLEKLTTPDGAVLAASRSR